VGSLGDEVWRIREQIDYWKLKNIVKEQSV